MTRMPPSDGTLTLFDDATRALVRLSAIVTAGPDDSIRDALAHAAKVIPPVHVIDAAIAALTDLLGPEHARSVELLWARVRGK